MSYDVVVAGGGPVGLMIACELRLHDVSTLVLEQLSEPDETIKAGSITVPTAEALYRRGMLPAMAEVQEQARAKMLEFMRQRFPDAPAGSGPKFAGHFAGLWKLDPSRLDPADPDVSYSPAVGVTMVRQQELETLLGERAAHLGAQIRRGCTVTGLHDDGDGVEVTFDGPDGPERIRAGYLVGCDGGRSAVRKAAGFDFPGTSPTITGHQAMATLEGAEALKLGWHRTERGLIVYGPFPGRVLTVEYDGPPADRDAPVTVEELQASIRKVSGVDVTVTDIQSVTRFTDNARQVTSYRIGRVLLAGDAAHVHSPFGGQGLNLGIGDAMNLGWKLAATVRGWAPDGLLDTYTTERHPIGAWVLDWTRAQVALMRTDPQSRALRAVVADLLDTTTGTTYMAKKISGLWQGYGDDPVVGRSAPDLALADGSRLDDHLHDGRGLLLDLADTRPDAAGYEDRVTVVSTKAGGDTDLTALLVRPDGTVAWAGDGSPADALATWFGRPGR